MKLKTFVALLLLLCTVLTSCKKDSNLNEKEKQELEEQTAALLPNEIREQEGIRFIINYDQESAKIALKLFRGTGVAQTPIKLDEEQPFVNYSVLTDSLSENSEFTIQADFSSVTKGGTIDITVIGFTNLDASKKFTVSTIQFSPTDQGSVKSILRMKKGLKKYSFYAFQ
ncbi:hypothetical protein [Flavitalea sp.]|nr:hypothetical protein [Flavitalea sp.]